MVNGRLLPTSVVLLVVDDEPFVLNCVCSVLEHAGFKVLRAASSAEAQRIAEEHRAPIHLILSDVIMPGLTGPSMAERIAESHRESRLLFMAGLPDHPEVADRVLARGHAFLAKPFIPQTLVRKVNELLMPSVQASAATA